MIPRQDAPTISHASVNDTRPMPAVPAPVGTAAWVNGVPGTRGWDQGLRMRDGRSRSFSGGTWLRGHPSARKRCWTSFSRRFCSMAPGPGTDVAQAGELDGGRTRDEGRQVQGRGGGVVYGRDGFGVGPGGRVLRMRGGRRTAQDAQDYKPTIAGDCGCEGGEYAAYDAGADEGAEAADVVGYDAPGCGTDEEAGEEGGVGKVEEPGGVTEEAKVAADRFEGMCPAPGVRREGAKGLGRVQLGECGCAGGVERVYALPEVLFDGVLTWSGFRSRGWLVGETMAAGGSDAGL